MAVEKHLVGSLSLGSFTGSLILTVYQKASPHNPLIMSALITIPQPDPLRSPHHDKPIAYDLRYLPDGSRKPVIIFVHGFKGFKDWGYFNLLADAFAQAGFVYLKLNLSHNGTTPEHPTDFADLEAFGQNNFTKEMDDLGLLIDHVYSPEFAMDDREVDPGRLFLIGHSRGGSLVILKGYEDERVKGVVTLAAVSDLAQRWSDEQLAKWKEERVTYVANSRTGQNMPMDYQLVEDFNLHRERFDVPRALKNLGKPLLAFHGSEDETVPVQAAHDIKKWNATAEIEIIEGANHVFGGKHPYEASELPTAMRRVLTRTTKFLKEIGY